MKHSSVSILENTMTYFKETKQHSLASILVHLKLVEVQTVNTALHTDIKANSNGIIISKVLLTTGSYYLQRTNSSMR